MKLSTNIIFYAALGFPASAADLIRCPDAASLMAAPALAAASPKQDFASLVATRATSAVGAEVQPVSTAPLDPMGMLTGSKPAKVANTSLHAAPKSAPETNHAGCAYIIQSGDTLGRIAAAKLGGANRWSEIQAMNPELDPNSLFPGRQITLPCAGVTATKVPAAATPVSQSSGPSVSARTFVAPSAPGVVGKAPNAPAVVAAPAPVILPTWTAHSDEFFSDVVKRWAKREDYSVIFSTTADWKLAVAVSEQGTFEDVLDRLAKGLGANGRPPVIQLFPNKVIKIGGGA